MAREDPDRTPRPELGWSAQSVQEEFPQLHLHTIEVSARADGSSSPALESQLRELSNRWNGARAVNLRRQPIPAAYRVFFRHIGLDPDVTRTPIEAAVFQRLMNGGFLPSGRLEDVLLLALVETGVPVWALDADTVDGPLGIRTSDAGERLGCSPEADPLAAGQLVVADAATALAVLFSEVAASHRPQRSTHRLILFTIQVAGVSLLHVEEAFWICASALQSS
ncbi:MAG: phenylalanine--tRNA ligase beta subunit-related protein [Solirubrobacteraceae bacterium]